MTTPDMPRIEAIFAGTGRADANELAKHCKALYERVRELEEEVDSLAILNRALDKRLYQLREFRSRQP